MRVLGVALLVSSTGAIAQTVTGSGTSGTVPVFNGTSTVTNSPISISGSNVGIGTTSPGDPLTVNATSGSDAIMIDQNGSLMNITGGNSSLPWYVYDGKNAEWVLQWNGLS
jgi:hypothetical protein